LYTSFGSRWRWTPSLNVNDPNCSLAFDGDGVDAVVAIPHAMMLFVALWRADELMSGTSFLDGRSGKKMMTSPAGPAANCFILYTTFQK
jgi:hypothetical protein